MEVKVIRFRRIDLRKLGKDKAAFLLQVSALMNYISVLQRLSLITHKPVRTNRDPNGSAQRVQGSFLLVLLAGILCEGWQTLQQLYFGRALSRDLDARLSDDARKSLENLKHYFGGKNNVKLVRDKVAFHFDSAQTEKALDAGPDDEVLSMVLSPHVGTTYYTFATDVMLWGVLNTINADDPGRALDELVNDVAVRVSSWFLTFGHELVSLLLQSVTMNVSEETIIDAPEIGAVQIPFFVLPNSSQGG